MSFFDNLKKKVEEAAASVLKNDSGSESFVFDDIPTTLDGFKALPGADLRNPAAVVALTIVALNVYPMDKDASFAMLNYLRGPEPLSNQAIAFINDRFYDNKIYVPRSYFKGATPDNDYAPQAPFTIEVLTTPHTRDCEKEGRLTFYVNSGGADNPRPC
ncbi:MAG: hypothetical protein IJV00_08045, partial [Clostridia bacterium]|nr:hypothetical protein [Clostridia bacterium]